MMITSGYIKLVTYTMSRQERIQYIAGPGEVIPMHNLFNEMPSEQYPLFAVAFSDVTYLSKQRQDFMKFIDTEPLVVIAILHGLMRGAFDRLCNLNLETPEQKVAHILVLYADVHGSQSESDLIFTKLDVPLTTHVVASSVYLSKEATDAIFKVFETQNYLKFEGNTILVAIDALKEVAELRHPIALTI